ncbi:MAG: response regulator [Bryobacteraceae bacterium]|nr:response regulator [Bryobacteraceae bacterium]MDW8379080.1 response regulator [Bryobacterales bacterium]
MREKSILVVEDSPTELKLLTTLLEGCGYHYTTATDGEEALQKAIQQKPDLMLLDVILPKRSGFQVCRQLKTSPETKSIKIIVVSSKNQESDRYWGLKQGADAYLFKPVKQEELLSVIAEQLASK